MSVRPRPAYDPWRDAHGVHIPDGCRVEQVGVQRDHGALPRRLHRRGEVLSRGSSRLRVRFDGETQPAGVRPYLLRVVPMVLTIGQIIAQQEELRALVAAEDRG